MKNSYFSTQILDRALLGLAALALIIGAVLFTFSPAHSEARPENVGQVKAFHGSITVTRAYTNESLKVDGQLPVMYRDLNETDFDSQVELQFKDGSTLVIGEDTVLSIDEMVFDPKTGSRSTKLNLKSGTIRVKATKNRNPNSRFEVATPSIVAGIRGTEFTVSVDKTGNARVITLEGAVATWKQGAPKGNRKEVLVVAGMTTGMAPGDAAPTNAKAATAKQIKSVTSATRIGGPAPKKNSAKVVRTASAAKGSKKAAPAIKNKSRLGGVKVASLRSTFKAKSRLVSRGAAKSFAAQASKIVAKRVARNTAKGVARNAARNAAKIAAKNVAKEAAKATVKEVARKAASTVAKNAANNAAKNAARNAASEAAKNNGNGNGNNGNNGKAKGKNK